MGQSVALGRFSRFEKRNILELAVGYSTNCSLGEEFNTAMDLINEGYAILKSNELQSL